MFVTEVGTFTTDGAALAAALLAVLLPLLAGVLAAAALRRAVSRPLPWAALLGAAALAAALLATRWTVHVGAMDLLALALAFTAGAAAVPSRPVDPLLRGTVAALARPLLGLSLVELAARALLPLPPDVPPPRLARALAPPPSHDAPCLLAFPSEAYRVSLLREGAPGRPTVLHVGDSMLQGNGLPAGVTFVARLGEAQPAVRHVNLGIAGAGPDDYVAILARFADATPRLTVVYVFAGNDLFDLGAPRMCCDGRPLTVESGDGLAPRCPTPRWRVPLRVNLATNPAPFALRVAATPSFAAAHLLTLAVRAQGAMVRAGWTSNTRRSEGPHPTFDWDRYARFLRTMRARRGPLLLVVLPTRPALERELGLAPSGHDGTLDGTDGRAVQRALVDRARAAGLDALDAWDVVRAMIARDGAPATFARAYPGDVHFSASGHRAFAAWIEGELRARGVR